MQPYQYQPLPSSSSIRVLMLYPAADTSSALECEIITTDRLTVLRSPQNKTFDAVSYVWGNGAHDIPLYCKSEGTYLYISGVVDGMLRSLRKGNKERRLWVDAICLNQKDNQEKSIQVQQMGQIYHVADKVHVWLGPAEATTRLAFAFLRTLVAKFEPLPDQAKDPSREEILQTFEETFQHRDFQPILSLLQKPWFTRRWTLQEGFLARDAIVRCGDSKIPWHWFTGGLNLIQTKCHEIQHIASDRDAVYALNVLRTLIAPADLLSLLWTLHMSQCSDPRDRIYSLLGLAQNMGPVADDAKAGCNSTRELLLPDYTLDTDAVYRGLASHCITADGLLQILLHIDAFGCLSDVDPKWPSWTPNWTTARDRRLDSPTALPGIMPRTHSLDKPLTWHEENLFHKKYGDCFSYFRPTEYYNGNDHGIILYGELFKQTVEACDQWLGNNDSEYLASHLADWIHQTLILHMPDQTRTEQGMQWEVQSLIQLLITGSDFFSYAKHSLLHDATVNKERVEYTQSGRITKLIYPIARKEHSLSRYFTFPYPPEQVRSKEHLDVNHESNPPPSAESRQELLDLVDDTSRMMREGKKQLIVASYEDDMGYIKRRRWIGPNDARTGDTIVDISYCGRVGVLLRAINSIPELDGRPAFQLIGILWSLRDNKRRSAVLGPNYSQLDGLKEFLIL